MAELALGEQSADVKTRYDKFLSKLFSNHPSQSHDVNRKPRLTALDMWDMNDNKKFQEGTRAVTKTIMDKDVANEEKQVTLVETDLEPSVDAQRSHIEVEDKSGIRDDAIKYLCQPLQELQRDALDEAIQALIFEGKQQWAGVDADMVTEHLPRFKRTRSSRNSSEMEGMGRKKRREELQKELDMIESLKRKIDSRDIELATVEKLKSGKMSLEELEHISGQIEQTKTPTSFCG